MVANTILESRTFQIKSKTQHFQSSCPFINGEGVSTRSDPCFLKSNTHKQSTNLYSTPFFCSCSSSSSVLKLYVLIKGNLNFLSQIKTCLRKQIRQNFSIPVYSNSETIKLVFIISVHQYCTIFTQLHYEASNRLPSPNAFEEDAVILCKIIVIGF